MGDPIQLASTMSFSSGKSYAFRGGATFTQAFRVQASGVPTQLIVRMGNNQTPYSARLRLLRGEQVLFDRTFEQRKQRRSDWATVFELDGLSSPVQAGEWISFTLTPGANVGIEPLFIDDPNVRKSVLTGYGAMAARFALLGEVHEERIEAPAGSIEIRRGLSPSDSHFRPQTLDDGTGTIGEPITVQAPNRQQYAVTGVEWTFAADNSLLLTYLQTELAGAPVRLPAVNSVPRDLTVYPQRTGADAFTARVHTVDAQDRRSYFDMPGTVRCQGPLISAPTSSVSTVLLTAGNAPTLSLGRAAAGRLGISIRSSCQARPGLPGQFGFIQLMRGQINVTRDGDTPINATTGGAWFLDNGPRAGGRLTYNGKSAVATEVTPTYLDMNDSPFIGLHRRWLRVDVDETFRTFLCFKSASAGSVWMSMGYIEWSWRAVASRTSLNAPWTLTGAYPTAGAAMLPFVTTGEVPVWAGNTSALVLQMTEPADPEEPWRPVQPRTIRLLAAGVTVLMVVRTILSAAQQSEAADTAQSPVQPIGTRAMAVWATPEELPLLRAIEGVESAEEIPVDSKISFIHPRTPGQQERYAAATKFNCSVAPQCLFEADADETAVASLCPFSLEQVGADLVARAQTAGVVLVAQVRTWNTLTLEFARHPTDVEIAAVAASASVYAMEVASEFGFDDPPTPRPLPNE